MFCFGANLDLEERSKNHRTLKVAGSAFFCACDLPLTLISVLATAMPMSSLE